MQLCGPASLQGCKKCAKAWQRAVSTSRLLSQGLMSSPEEDAGDAEREAGAAEVVPCAVCVTAAAKYKCPRCFVQTCSLPCVRRHKEETKCR